MSWLKLLLVVPLLFAVPAFAQQKSATSRTTSRSQGTVGGGRSAVAIQPPTNNPFQNPIGQGVAPAANANSTRNSNVVNTSPSR